MNRRTFLQSTAAFAARPALAQRSISPSNKITMGVIGCGNQGTGGLMNFLKDERIQVVAVCDVNRKRRLLEWRHRRAGARHRRMELCARQALRAIQGYALRRLPRVLARKDIDVLFIAIPDHWHSIPWWKARAGKDIYGRSRSRSPSEGRAMANAIKQNNRIFQCGSQQRSDARFRRACEIVRNAASASAHGPLRPSRRRSDFGRTGDRFERNRFRRVQLRFLARPAPGSAYSPPAAS